jgi:hypothetical protein
VSDGVTRLRRVPSGPQSTAERLADLQRAIAVERDIMEADLLASLEDMRVRLEEAIELLVKPGIKEEVRRLAEQVLGATQRIGAIRERGNG